MSNCNATTFRFHVLCYVEEVDMTVHRSTQNFHGGHCNFLFCRRQQQIASAAGSAEGPLRSSLLHDLLSSRGPQMIAGIISQEGVN